jgi:hypothetical protein
MATLAELRSRDTPPALQLGDRVAHHIRWLRWRELGQPRTCELQCARCPDCGRSFISALAPVWRRPRGMSNSRAERWVRRYWRRRSRCQICAAERLREQRRQAEQRRRERQRQPAETLCLHCGAAFHRQRTTARFCSARCRVAAHRAAQAPSMAASTSASSTSR